jgi:phosphopantothenate-cysteine ligase
MSSSKRSKPSEDEEYFASAIPPSDLDAISSQLDTFLAASSASRKHCVLLTSGGTTVPLERNTVRFIDNFSTGARGAHMAQEFLKSDDCAVVFLHRVGSVMPFTFNLASPHVDFTLLSQLAGGVNDMVRADAATLTAALHAKRLLAIPFVSVGDYLFKLRLCATKLEQGFPNGELLVVLAAAVSDFFVRDEDMTVHKIQSAAVSDVSLYVFVFVTETL